MAITKESMVAGLFYPDDPDELRFTIKKLLAQVSSDQPIPKAIIAPHAGYSCSGIVAARAYACLVKAKEVIKRVVLLGPAHRCPFSGITITEAEYFATPLGRIPIDHKAIAEIISLPQIQIVEQAYHQENSLEVQLPFLQELLNDFTLIPLLTGAVSVQEGVEVLNALWGDKETLIVISSDLSHYYDYKTASQMDQATMQAILNLEPEKIAYEQACGGMPIKILLSCVRSKRLDVSLIDLKNSGDTIGNKAQVVGYGAVHFYDREEGEKT